MYYVEERDGYNGGKKYHFVVRNDAGHIAGYFDIQWAAVLFANSMNRS